MSPPVPMLGDLALEHVTWAETRLSQRLIAVPVVGLAGDAQQNLGRASHEVALVGVLVGPDSADKLTELQKKAAAGEELDIAIECDGVSRRLRAAGFCAREQRDVDKTEHRAAVDIVEHVGMLAPRHHPHARFSVHIRLDVDGAKRVEKTTAIVQFPAVPTRIAGIGFAGE